MADVEGLTDSELRTKLMEFGFPVMPITGTTRKVMVKKLKMLMENKGKSANVDRRSLAQFSSEEESDTDVKVTKKKETRRQTMAIVPPMQPPVQKASARKSSKRIENDNDVIEVVPKVREERKSTRSTKIINLVEKEKHSDTNSDSEPDIVETDYKIPARNHFEKRDSPIKSSISSTTYSYSSTAKGYSPPKQTDSISSRNMSFLSSQSPSRYAAYNSPQVDAADKLNQIRSRLSLGAGNYESYAGPQDTNNDAQQTPFLSNFTKRLSQLSNTKGEFDKTDVIKEHDTNGSGVYNRSFLTRPRPREYSREYQSTKDGNSKGNYVSFILISSAALFFIILTALYWGLHSGNNNNEVAGAIIPYCGEGMSKGENCVVQKDVQGAIDLYRVIKPELIKLAIAQKCKDANIKWYMTEKDIVTFIKSNYAIKDEFVILEDLNNFVILMFSNPLWEVSVLQSPIEEFTETDRINNLARIHVNKRQNHYHTGFAVLEPSLPLSCSLSRFFTATLKTFAFILLASGALFGAKKGYRYYKHYEQRRKDEIILMVERIIDILQSTTSEEGDNFLVINHVRDMILPIDNRKSMESTWYKAVKFINENESRIRTEVQVVQGEPYEVWRWVGGHNTSSARNKSWQGQAFETQIGSVNSPPCSPTPCLKIRGMVDDGDRNLHTIREAVLVKCADQCRILHCAVDVNSKCVYLKCADQNDAAIAYRNLHGWWYASHLVTVKYLRLERYMQRFPDSPQSGPPFLKAHQAEWSK